MSKIGNTSECEGCTYCTIDESNKARVKVICRLRDNKELWYGMYYECEAFTKKSQDQNSVLDTGHTDSTEESEVTE